MTLNAVPALMLCICPYARNRSFPAFRSFTLSIAPSCTPRSEAQSSSHPHFVGMLAGVACLARHLNSEYHVGAQLPARPSA